MQAIEFSRVHDRGRNYVRPPIFEWLSTATPNTPRRCQERTDMPSLRIGLSSQSTVKNWIVNGNSTVKGCFRQTHPERDYDHRPLQGERRVALLPVQVSPCRRCPFRLWSSGPCSALS